MEMFRPRVRFLQTVTITYFSKDRETKHQVFLSFDLIKCNWFYYLVTVNTVGVFIFLISMSL